MKASTQRDENKRGGLRKIAQTASTALLILCTLLCFVVVVRSATGKDISLFGYRLFYVITGSMEPTLPVNSLLIVGESDSYEVDDIITFYSTNDQISGYPNTHRIIAKASENGENVYVTQGDANPVPDDEPVRQSDIIGKVVFTLSAGGFIGVVLEVLGTPIGFFSVILIPLLVVAVICMKDFKKALKDEMYRKVLEELEAEQSAQKEESDNEDE